MSIPLGIKLDLLSEGRDDFLGLWEILWVVTETLGVDDDIAAKKQTLGIVWELLVEGHLQVGDVAPGGASLTAWEVPVDEAIDRIAVAWNFLRREPRTGEIAWFETTRKGEEWLAAHGSKRDCG